LKAKLPKKEDVDIYQSEKQGSHLLPVETLSSPIFGHKFKIFSIFLIFLSWIRFDDEL